MPISTDLKKAILAQPTLTKDKLLLRLISRNSILVEQLEYQLIEEELTLLQRRDSIKDQLQHDLKPTMHYPKELLEVYKKQIAAITRHTKVCKDKYGEIELTLDCLLVIFKNKPLLLKNLHKHNDKLCHYLVRKMLAILKKIELLEVDLKLDFLNITNEVLIEIHRNATKNYADKYEIPTQYNL
jgi:hypothetical protein